jgi:cytoskeletal protein CcmA (bactofilin family)
MPEPLGQVSHLKNDASRLSQTSTAGAFADSLPDTSSYFEAWLKDLNQPELHKDLAPQAPAVDTEHAAGEFRFEGTLQVDGYAKGRIYSLTGTLILGEAAELQSNIVVATAIINGCLFGDIHATERVELLSHARVIGNIESPALAIQPGAIFEGECHYLPSPVKLDSADSDGEARRVTGRVSLAPGFSQLLDKSSAKIETV